MARNVVQPSSSPCIFISLDNGGWSHQRPRITGIEIDSVTRSIGDQGLARAFNPGADNNRIGQVHAAVEAQLAWAEMNR